MRLSAVILPSPRWREAQSLWRAADEAGLYAGYTYDHLSWRTFREKSWFAMTPVLTAAALVTTNLRLGPLVTSPNFRHPLPLVKDLIALDDISNGRLIVGVGAGGAGPDATALGRAAWSTGERHEHFVEFTRAIDTLLREPASNLPGPLYPVVDSRQIPGPVQQPRPPLVVSALGPKGLDLCAELADGWVTYGSPTAEGDVFEALATQVAKLDEALARRDREQTSMQRVLLDFAVKEQPLASYDRFITWAGRAHELGMTEVVVHWPIADSEYDVNQAVFERVLSEGVSELARWP